MPQLKLTLGNVTHTLEEGDLSARARFSRGTFAVLSDLLGVVQNKPIAQLGNETIELKVGVAEALEWEVPFGGAGGLIGISFTPDVRGGIVIRRAGELFRFSTGRDERAEVVRVPSGKAYVSVTLNVGYEANVSGEFTHGAFGVGANVDKEQRFRIATHCCVDDSMQVGAALVEAFRRFRLPFQPDRLPESLEDFVEYEFYGRLALGVSAAAGFRGFLFGGRTRAELEKTFRSDAGSALRVQPGIGAGVGIDVNWDQQGAFRVVLGSTEPGKLRLYLFKKDERTLSATLSASARVLLVTPFDLQKQVDALLELAGNRVFSALPSGAKRSALVKALVERMKSSPEALKNFLSDIKTETNGFLTRLGGMRAVGAEASFERIESNTALLHYEFELPLKGPGFGMALAGDFRNAVKQKGVTLGTGSYVEESLVKRSSIRFQVFDAFRAKSVEEFFKKSTIEYIGGGVFELRYVTGKRASREVFGRERAVEMYFAASAESAEEGAIRGQDVVLYFLLSEANDPRAARQIAGVVGSIAPGSGAADALRRAIDQNPKLTAKVICKVAASAYGRLSFTAFRAKDKPHELPHTEDALNYAAFVSAVDSLFDQGGFDAQGFPNAVDRFADWAYYNVTANDAEGAAAPPNRRLRGNLQAWPTRPGVRASFVLDKPMRSMIRTYLLAAQAFLNLCEDLVILSSRIDGTDTEKELKDLAKWLDDLIQKDSSGFPLHFTNPTLMALAARMNARVTRVDTKAAEGAMEIQIDLE